MTCVHYLDRIFDAEHDYELDEIVEQASWDEELTDEELTTIEGKARHQYWTLNDPEAMLIAQGLWYLVP